MTLTAIKYDEEEHVLSLLDQRALPTTTTYIQCTTSHQVTMHCCQLADCSAA
jgi:methylthioribose-1-phosphate isomerase